MVINQNPGLNKADAVLVSILNGDTVTIPTGAPVVLYPAGTSAVNGLTVALPSTVASLGLIQSMFYGVNTQQLVVGAMGNATLSGMCFSLLFESQTRSSSTVNWAAFASQSIGQYMTIDTVNNMFVTAASTIQYASASTAATPLTITLQGPGAVLMQTIAAYVSSASATSDTRTSITYAVNAFVRSM